MQVKPKFPICLLISLTIAGEKSKSFSTIQTSLSTSENKLAVKSLLGDLDKNLARFEEELGSRLEKDQNRWMIEGMYSALDINVGVFLHYLRRIGLLHQLLLNKPALSHLWDGVMRRPHSLEVCQAGVAMMETSGRADVVGSLPHPPHVESSQGSEEGGSQEEDLQENDVQIKERKKLRRKKQNEDRSWYSLW